MVPVVVSVAATDNCSGPVESRIIEVTSNEPVNGPDDGDTAPDWVITGPLTIDIRAERSGSGIGRVYTITVESGDQVGNVSTSTVMVQVPKNQGK